MTSLTFSMAMFCDELNDLITENKLRVVYCKDYFYECKSYLFTHLKENPDEDDGKDDIKLFKKQNKARKNKKYLVDKIDYHKINENNFFLLVDELKLLFEFDGKYKKGKLTTIICMICKNGVDDFIHVDYLWKIESEFKS